MRLTSDSSFWKPSGERGILLGLFLLSAATLSFEINLTRLFSVAQFYHFAFMIVSIALLGYAASGTALTVFPALQKGVPAHRLSQLAFATGLSILAAFLLINRLPFDSFSIAWDPKQVWILTLQYVALAAPFFFSGAALAFLLSISPQSAADTYAVNLLGSATGCIVALVAPVYLGGEGMVLLSIALAALAGISAIWSMHPFRRPHFIATCMLLLLSLLGLGLAFAGDAPLPVLSLRLSPYKSLSYALQYPEARVIDHKWNAFSLVDVVRSTGIHSLPGLSYRFMGPLPSLDALFVDGDDLNPVIPSATESAFVDSLPNAVAFHLRPEARTLVLEPRGGLDILTALELGSGEVTAVEMNPLIVDAVPVYRDPRVQVYVEADRSYLRRTQDQFDVIVLALTSSFHPVGSGAYTLVEDYRYTVESFNDALSRLAPGGLLVATRWLQDPPSEDLRLFALAVTALEQSNADPLSQLVALRGFNTATILLKKTPFTGDELSSIRTFASERAFDLSYAPDIEPGETNQYNILPQSTYYQTYSRFLGSRTGQEFYDSYEYDVRPPTDDHPFFGHYFKWSQAPQIAAEFGKVWQPFGGAGFFVIVGLLILAILLASLLVLLPVVVWKPPRRNVPSASPFVLRNLMYFGLLGLAFLLVEVPLLQRFILYLGQPAYAFTMVLFSLLFFSGLGSRSSNRIPLRLSLGVLVFLILVFPVVLPRIFAWTLGLPLPVRLGLTFLSLAPLGFLMGIPFPAGIRLVHREQAPNPESDPQEGAIPWIWAVNGAASVVASILSALLALTLGFDWVLRLGAICYAGAWITVLVRPSGSRHPVP